MQITNVRHEGNVTTTSSVVINGPLAHISGIIYSTIISIVGIILTLMTILSCGQYLKTKDYPQAQATIIAKEEDGEVDIFTLAYNIAGQNYTYDRALMVDKQVGEVITISYNPSDYKDIYWQNTQPSFILALLAFAFDAVGVSTLVRNIKKLLHFINPEKYEEVKDEDSLTVATGDGGFKTSMLGDEYTDGSHTEIKF